MIVSLDKSARIRLPLLDMMVKRANPIRWACGGNMGFYRFDMVIPGFEDHLEDIVWSSWWLASRLSPGAG